MILWRIAAETRSCGADDLSGAGAAKHPGRWNDSGQAVVYCAPSIAMAVLETAAHINDTGLPLNRFLVEIKVPERVWAARQIIEAASLPLGWQAIPAGRVSTRVGSYWIQSMASALLEVPSAIVPEEPTVIINPKHRDARFIKAKITRPFEYNRLLRASS